MAVRMAAAVSPGEEKPGVDSVVVAAAAKELKTAMKTASKHALVRAATDGSMRYIGAKEDLNWRQKIWMTLDDPSFSKASFWYAQFSLGVIVVSTLSFCLETELTCTLKDDHEWLFVNASTNGENTCGRWEDTWKFLEMVAVYIFSAELVLRFATASPAWPHTRPWPPHTARPRAPQPTLSRRARPADAQQAHILQGRRQLDRRHRHRPVLRQPGR